MNAKKVALAYSGGLDTSIIIPWLKENYGCEVVAVCGDIGQGGEELTGLEAKARTTGASEVEVADMREEFVRDYLWKLVRSGGVYEHKYLLGTSIARPLLAKRQVEAALRTGCDALAHGCTGKGNDQVRFELTYKALAPELPVIAPWREWTLISREDCIEYAAKHNVPIAQSTTKIYSRDRNSRSYLDAHKESERRTRYAGRCHHRIRAGDTGFRRRQKTSASRIARNSERRRQQAWSGAHRPGGEPFRRHEIARLL
jgi:argininosuccinate synthase